MDYILRGARLHTQGQASIYTHDGHEHKPGYVAVLYSVPESGLSAEAHNLLAQHEPYIVVRNGTGFVMRPGTAENLQKLRSTAVLFKGNKLELRVAEALKEALERTPENKSA